MKDIFFTKFCNNIAYLRHAETYVLFATNILFLTELKNMHDVKRLFTLIKIAILSIDLNQIV